MKKICIWSFLSYRECLSLTPPMRLKFSKAKYCQVQIISIRHQATLQRVWIAQSKLDLRLYASSQRLEDFLGCLLLPRAFLSYQICNFLFLVTRMLIRSITRNAIYAPWQPILGVFQAMFELIFHYLKDSPSKEIQQHLSLKYRSQLIKIAISSPNHEFSWITHLLLRGIISKVAIIQSLIWIQVNALPINR